MLIIYLALCFSDDQNYTDSLSKIKIKLLLVREQFPALKRKKRPSIELKQMSS